MKTQVKHLITFVLFFSIFMCPNKSFAVPMNITGNISGNINGEIFTATSSGFGDPDTGNGQAIVNFSNIPNNFSVFSVKNSWLSLICSIFCFQWNGGTNLYTLTEGDYSLTRDFYYPDFPGSSISLSGNVSTSGNDLIYSETWSGTYNGATDLMGVFDYEHYLIPNGAGNVIEEGTAIMRDLNGIDYLIPSTGTISGFTGELSITQIANIDWISQELNGNILTLEWQGTVQPVPEPNTIFLLAIGIIGIVGIKRKKLIEL